MKPKHLTLGIGGGVVLLSLVFLLVHLELAADEPVPEFSFSSDPTEEILIVQFIGGNRGINPAFFLYGDGRLEIREQTMRGQVFSKEEVKLSYQEMHDLIALAVSSGLAELSSEEIRQSMLARRKGRGLPILSDAADLRITLRLTSLGTNEDGESAAVDTTVLVRAPKLMLRYIPDLRPLTGAAALLDTLMQYGEVTE